MVDLPFEIAAEDLLALQTEVVDRFCKHWIEGGFLSNRRNNKFRPQSQVRDVYVLFHRSQIHSLFRRERVASFDRFAENYNLRLELHISLLRSSTASR